MPQNYLINKFNNMYQFNIEYEENDEYDITNHKTA